MSKLVVNVDAMIACPLLKREISESYCAEVNLVAFGICVQEMIADSIDRKEAELVCEVCPHRSL